MSDTPEPRKHLSVDDPKTRPIRSYVVRQGRMSPAQERFIAEGMPRWGVEYSAAPLDYAAAFGRAAPTILEIGFGMGDTTAAIAQTRPGDNFLGIEVHGPGVGNLCKLIEERGISNIRVMQHDAFEVVRDMLADASLAGVHVYFPDPWHKARHNKRRLIQSPFVHELAKRLVPGGYIHCATDWEDYAVQMLEVLSAEPMLENTADGYAPKPDYRPLTKFENRGLKLGHGVWDLVFRRKA
ncbi:tRNA (guanosine(46)-N7)-methyltransferase TrmB [Niveibacterium sp. COAC-50]|uniref:tRNA (guanosine(46)-N7)-methyltransferase TrmB n=1 Tax=Niveibacterium sp. COAC-50 TaxID=2729384 RepID=UPI0015563A17|nr:tRNA (guanosine(46)-N7)-methyltransferase TrmB [Niveibacterium sp. COAC-50]